MLWQNVNWATSYNVVSVKGTGFFKTEPRADYSVDQWTVHTILFSFHIRSSSLGFVHAKAFYFNKNWTCHVLSGLQLV